MNDHVKKLIVTLGLMSAKGASMSIQVSNIVICDGGGETKAARMMEADSLINNGNGVSFLGCEVEEG